MDKTIGSASKMLLYVSFINWNMFFKKWRWHVLTPRECKIQFWHLIEGYEKRLDVKKNAETFVSRMRKIVHDVVG